jgi:hypothetical protein
LTTKNPNYRSYWKGEWIQMGAEKFRGTKNGIKPACPLFKWLSVNAQNDILIGKYFFILRVITSSDIFC